MSDPAEPGRIPPGICPATLTGAQRTGRNCCYCNRSFREYPVPHAPVGLLEDGGVLRACDRPPCAPRVVAALQVIAARPHLTVDEANAITGPSATKWLLRAGLIEPDPQGGLRLTEAGTDMLHRLDLRDA